MNICEIEEDELLDINFSENPDKYFKYYHEIMNSNLSILRIYYSICESNNLKKKNKDKKGRKVLVLLPEKTNKKKHKLDDEEL